MAKNKRTELPSYEITDMRVTGRENCVVFIRKMMRKEQRLEKKKQKAKALLQLIKDEDKEKKKDSPSSPAVEEHVVPMKILKTEESCGTNSNAEVISANTALLSMAGQVSQETYEELKRKIKQKQKASLEKPKLYLTLEDLKGSSNQSDVLPPLFMSDVRHLILQGIQKNLANVKPRWCRLLRMGKVSQVVVIVLSGVSSTEYKNYTNSFNYIHSRFPLYVDVISPAQFNSSMADVLLTVPLTVTQMRKRYFKGDRHSETVPKEEVPLILEAARPFNISDPDKFDRTLLLLSSEQMIEDGFPIPIVTERRDFSHFVFSKDEYKEVSASSPIFGLDCEMCQTTDMRSELTRISIVNEKLQVVYDKLVKPYNKINNYLTRFSGITKKILDPVETRLHDVQEDLRRLIPANAILAGQSLNGDLMALQMFHPFVIDTSVIFNLSGYRGRKTGLKKLTSYFLGRDIQWSDRGHNSVEDATATLELVLLKLKNTVDFGDVTLGGEILPYHSVYNEENFIKAQNQSEANEKCQDQPAQWKQSNSSTLETEEDMREQGASGDSITCVVNNGKCDTDKEKSNSVPLCDNVHLGKQTINTPKGKSYMDKMKAFFEHLQNTQQQSLFEVTKEMGKKSLTVDRPNALKSVNSVDVVIETSSDKESRKKCKEHMSLSDLVWVQLHDFADLQQTGDDSPENIQNTLEKLDHRVKKIVKHAWVNALVAVVMTGRLDEEKHHNAMTFISIA